MLKLERCQIKAFYGAIATSQAMIVNGFVNVGITSLEKRFDIESTDAGLIASCYDIATVICLIPVGYFGGHGSKPRWLGFGALIMGVGAFIFALPHFTTGLYELVEPTIRLWADKSLCLYYVNVC